MEMETLRGTSELCFGILNLDACCVRLKTQACVQDLMRYMPCPAPPSPPTVLPTYLLSFL